MMQPVEKNKNHYAVLMAGGVGSRFWPVSRTKYPKQFRDLLGSGETLIQTTYRRLATLVPEENILILTNREYGSLVKNQLPTVSDQQIVMEPVMRNTAPAVLLAALKIQKMNPEAVMVMAPSDHWIENEEAFFEDIKMGFDACAKRDRIITLGIKPSFPNTGYGYIEFEEEGEGPLKRVIKFTEKPDVQRAQQFLKKGNFLWNAGIFIWRVNFIVELFEEHLPALFGIFSRGVPALNTSEESNFLRENYSKAEDISIDYGILEKEADSIFVILARFEWSDLGTWGSLYLENEKDAQNNVVLNARVLATHAEGNIISSSSNKVVVVDGLKDYIVVDEDEILMIVPKEKEQEIKQIKEEVRKQFGDNLE